MEVSQAFNSAKNFCIHKFVFFVFCSQRDVFLTSFGDRAQSSQKSSILLDERIRMNDERVENDRGDVLSYARNDVVVRYGTSFDLRNRDFTCATLTST